MFFIAGIFSGVFVVLAALGQSDQQRANPGKDPIPITQARPAASSVVSSSAPGPRSLYISSQRNKRAENYYKSIWGIEKLEVRETSSGALVRFSYQITDANRARVLNDEKATPYMIDEMTGAVLQVPSLPKVGMLRQTANPANGREYWMVFSNKGVVKTGSRVDVVIGNFRAVGLVVR